MRCPFCGNSDSKVIDTRALEENAVIRRRRLCEKCNEKFTTYERLDTIALTVIKKNGTIEMFDRDKIINGLLRSCNKRPVSMAQIEELVSGIENHFINSMKKEVETKEIGEMVMQKLKDLDEVSYVRFASVYRHFKDVDSFMTEIVKMLKDKQE